MPARSIFAQAPAIVRPSAGGQTIDYGRLSGPAGSESSEIIWAHVDRPALMHVDTPRHLLSTTPRRVAASLRRPNGLTARTELRDLGGRTRFSTACTSRLSQLARGQRARSGPFPHRAHHRASAHGVDSRRMRPGGGIDHQRAACGCSRPWPDANPDLFIHVGDTIYADGPLAKECRSTMERSGAIS